jgi:hypothetical protein
LVRKGARVKTDVKVAQPFAYPIGVLLFNRPHLAKFVLKSLKNSTIPIREDMLVFHLDGFFGSKFEEQLEKNRVAKTEKLIRKYFPSAHIIKQEKNIGIARSFYAVMDYIFHKFDCEFAVFQEEDVFLLPHYLKTMSTIIESTNHLLWLGAISINDHDHYQNGETEFVVPTFGTREFALKREIFIDNKEKYQAYLDSLGLNYRSKRLEDVNLALERHGMRLSSAMQDVFQHEMIRCNRKLHLRINVPGSFQANFSGGESISGISITKLAANLFRNSAKKSRIIIKQDVTQLKFLNHTELEKYENELWSFRMARKNWDTIKPAEIKLIMLRNKLRLTIVKILLESLIISKELQKFKSRMFVEVQ